MNVLIDALAVARLTRLVTEDTITEPLRERLSDRERLHYLITCPWCSSPYIAAGALLARRFAPGLWDPLARVLAFSEVAGLIAER